jgi:hypothetical protein
MRIRRYLSFLLSSSANGLFRKSGFKICQLSFGYHCFSTLHTFQIIAVRNNKIGKKPKNSNF